MPIPDRRRDGQPVEVHRFLSGDALRCVFQPIVDARTRKVLGMEALSRFDDACHRPPDFWFSEAAQVGLSAALEAVALKKQLAVLPLLPDDVYLSLNVSPGTVMSGTLTQVLVGQPLHRIVVELTEHTLVPEYLSLERMLTPLRENGLRLAVDDAGAGYATFRHILKLAPDIIKLDLSLTRGVDTDRAKRALASALFRFGEEMGCTIIPEGVETDEELGTLRGMGGTVMQGYLFGRPAPIEEIAFDS